MMKSEVMKDGGVETSQATNAKRFVVDTVVVALVAAFATFCTATCKLEVWVMFAGLTAWFTHPTSWREGASGVLCMWLGLAAGTGSVVANDALAPVVGSLALPLVVFVATVVVVGLRATRGAKNTLAWFVGLVTFFAAHMKPSAVGLLQLGAASLVGGFAGFLCLTLAPGLDGPPAPAEVDPTGGRSRA
jgi:hypothetical protein